MTDRPLNGAERWFAAEHAMGLTEGDARLEAERRMERDGAFRAEVELWRSDFEPLLDRVEPVRPPRRVWSALRRRVSGGGMDGTLGGSSGPALSPWRGFALFGAGSVLGALLFLAIVGGGAVPNLVPSADGPEPAHVAVLSGDGVEGAVVVSAGEEGAVLTVRHSASVPEGRVAEAWVIPEGGGPVSLGTLEDDGGGRATATLQPDAPLKGTFAVSIEPSGGSPEPGPTGPVILTGALSEI